MQKLNCSLCYSLVNYGCKCTTFFIHPNKKDKKNSIKIVYRGKPSVFISSVTIYCKKFLYLHIKNRELIDITLKYIDNV